jgi:hypothetical protein
VWEAEWAVEKRRLFNSSRESNLDFSVAEPITESLYSLNDYQTVLIPEGFGSLACSN